MKYLEKFELLLRNAARICVTRACVGVNSLVPSVDVVIENRERDLLCSGENEVNIFLCFFSDKKDRACTMFMHLSSCYKFMYRIY